MEIFRNEALNFRCYAHYMQDIQESFDLNIELVDNFKEDTIFSHIWIES